MHELHLRKSGFTYSACEPFPKDRERIPKFRETGNLNHMLKKKWDKTCFVDDAVYSHSKDLA